MDDIPITVTVDLSSITDEMHIRARDLAIVINDLLDKQEDITNFDGAYACLLVAGANLAMMAPAGSEQLPYLLAWSTEVIRDYVQRMHKLPKGLH